MKKISLKKLVFITEIVLLLITLFSIITIIVSSEKATLTSIINNNATLVNGLLKSSTDVYNGKKILDRYYKDETTLDELYNYLNSRSKNSNSFKYYISIDGKEYSEVLPDYIKQNTTSIENNKRTIIYNNNNFYVTNKIRVKDSTILNVYNISSDSALKSKIETTDFVGLILESDEESYTWFQNEKALLPDKLIDMKKYSPGITNRFIKVKNNSDIPGLYYIFNDRPHTIRVRKTFIIVFSVFIILFITAIGLTRYFTGIMGKLLTDIEKIGKGQAPGKRYNSFKEYNKIVSEFSSVIKSRTLAENRLLKSNREMEEEISKRTKDLTLAIKRSENANKEKMNLLAQISHEIRTPMNCIVGFSEMIMDNNSLPESKKIAGKIIEESETLLKLINDILDDSKIESGKMELQSNRVNIKEFFNRLMESGSVYHSNSIDIDMFIDKKLPESIGIDELRFYQIVSNIYFNALKYTPIGTINIKVLKGLSSTIIISIEDSGVGIPSEKLESIFDDYERANGDLSTRFRGTGLGLSITKKIIELMNGKVDVESEKGVGSRFTITLPYKHLNSDKLSNKITTIKESIKLNGDVLLVEDYPTNRVIAKRHLESAGLNVFIAENGAEAIDICSEKKFNLILMDIQMPVLDGFSAASQIKNTSNINRETPIVAMTANGLQSVKKRSVELGMKGVILKPIKKREFINNIKDHLKFSSPEVLEVH